MSIFGGFAILTEISRKHYANLYSCQHIKYQSCS